MLDALGREIDYVRISVTDRCNLRCIYCMPEDGIQMMRHEDILTYDEIVRVCRIFAAMGIKYIRITGGEPLVRRDIIRLLKSIKAVKGIEKVTLTTNGVLLSGMIQDLKDSDIDGINISLDSLDRETYAHMTRYDCLQQVIEGIDEALRLQIPVKINCVSMRDQAGNGVLDAAERIRQVAELARDRKMDVRFIELMPIGYGKQYGYLPEDEIKDILSERFGILTEDDESRGNGPGHYYTLAGFAGKIGFISAMSHQFCQTCNRVRLTSQGYLKSCLQYNIGTDLREKLRSNGRDEEIEALIRQAILDKPEKHQFREAVTDQAERSCMSQIGG
ncbi:MAG: GTP 3',8-cyclase MoaA [bacterium]|nr:GTP 3',8-cyclase MoaA [bacterium]